MNPTFTPNPHNPPNPHQPWRYFLDHDPWAFQKALPENDPALQNQLPSLPLPPDPAKVVWKGRCYNCLELGHDQNDCTSIERTCAKCRKKGHQARDCKNTALAKRNLFDPLRPRGNLGDSRMPPNRPKLATVFIQETKQMYLEGLDLNRAVVIDVRLRPNHSNETIQSVLMAACNSDHPLPVTHMSGPQYLLLLQPGADRHRFLTTHTDRLKSMGYVLYPWSPGINAYPMRLKFKAWLRLTRLSPQAWNLDHIIPVTSSFGIVLDHSPIANVRSLNQITVVVAVPTLEVIPMAIRMWVKGMARDLEVEVQGWIEEPLPFIQPIDTTPSKDFFEEVWGENLRAVIQHANQSAMAEMVTVDFKMLFDVWAKMGKGEERDKLEETLKTSPYFLIREKELMLHNLTGGDKNIGGPTTTPAQAGRPEPPTKQSQTKVMDTSGRRGTRERLTKAEYLNSWKNTNKSGNTSTSDGTQPRRGTQPNGSDPKGPDPDGSSISLRPNRTSREEKGKGIAVQAKPRPSWADMVEEEEQEWAQNQNTGLLQINEIEGRESSKNQGQVMAHEGEPREHGISEGQMDLTVDQPDRTEQQRKADETFQNRLRSALEEGLMDGAKTIDEHCMMLEMQGLAKEEARKEKGKDKQRKTGESSGVKRAKTKKKTEQTQKLRRSVRISGRSPQTKFFTRKKGDKGETSAAKARRKQI